MNRPKNQHWVPQFYLRHFATPETRDSDQAQAWIFSKDESDGEDTLTNIRNVCAKRYLYSPMGEAGDRVWDLESKLEGLETTMSSAWPALAVDHVDLGDKVLRKGLSLFVALMHLRNPDTLREIEDAHAWLSSFKRCQPTGLEVLTSRVWRLMACPIRSTQVDGMTTGRGGRITTIDSFHTSFSPKP